MNAVELACDYISMWNETDDCQRRSIVERIWTSSARSVDPATDVSGWDDLDAMVKTVQQTHPNHQFNQVGEVDAHHDRLRFSWEMKTPASDVHFAGIDSVLVDSDGHIEDLTGFFDVTPT